MQEDVYRINIKNKSIILFFFVVIISMLVGVIIGLKINSLRKQELIDNSIFAQNNKKDKDNVELMQNENKENKNKETDDKIKLKEQAKLVENLKKIKNIKQTKLNEEKPILDIINKMKSERLNENVFSKEKVEENKKEESKIKSGDKVKNIPEYPSSVMILPSGEVHLSTGDTYQLKVKNYPELIKNNVGTWKSTDESIATVDSNGKITGIRNGFCDIIYKSANGIQSSKHIGVFYTVLGTRNINKVIYNKNGIKITAERLIYNMEAYSSPIYFNISNNSGKTIGVFVSNKQNNSSISDWGVTINGKKIDSNQMGDMWISYDVVNDSRKRGYISFKQDYLRTNKIKEIKTLSFYLIITDENNKQEFSSDLITINL